MTGQRKIRERWMRSLGPGALLLLAIAPSLARAQEPGSSGAPSAEELEWKPSYHRAGWWDAGMIAGGFGVYLLEATVLPRSNTPSWQGPILFDEPLRDLLRAHSPGDRNTAATISDVMLFGSLAHNLLFDSMFVALTLHRKPDVAWQMVVMSAQAYSLSFGVTSLVKNLAGRERPYVAECEKDPNYSDKCGTSGLRSFYSGHAAATATGAGLLCAHHTHLPLYDGKILDYGACGVGIAMTVLTAAMRMSADRHYASDVLMGHLVGFSAGYLVPTLLYYHEPEQEAEDADDALLLPDVGPDRLGVSLIGRM